MFSHLTRRTPVPLDINFAFSEQAYIDNLEKYEIQRANFDANGQKDVTDENNWQQTHLALCYMLRSAIPTNSMRYDFIQHYIAYHRYKIHELDTAMSPLNPPAANSVQGIQQAQLNEKLRSRKKFYQHQARFLQRALVHRAGHAAHTLTLSDSYGQQFYNAVDGHVASVYEADRSDRADVAYFGAAAIGITAPVYVGDVRQYEDGTLRRYNGHDFV